MTRNVYNEGTAGTDRVRYPRVIFNQQPGLKRLREGLQG